MSYPLEQPKAKRYVPVFDSSGKQIPSLYKDKSYFVFQYRPAGYRYSIKKTLTATSLKEAKREIDILKGENAKASGSQVGESSSKALQEALGGQPSTFRAMVNNWLSNKANSVRPSTYRCYKADLDAWVEAIGGDVPIASVGTRRISEALETWRGNKTGDRATIYRCRKRLATLRLVFRYAKIKDEIKEIPFDLDLGRELLGECEKIQKRPLLTPEQVKEIIEHARQITDGPTGRGLNGPMTADVVELVVWTGMRKEEAFSLKWSQIDFEQKKVIVIKEKRPQDRGYKTIPFFDRLTGIYYRLRDEAKARGEYIPDDYVFKGNHMGKPIKDLRKPFHEAVKRAGLLKFADDPERKENGLPVRIPVNWQDFRAYFINKMLELGATPEVIALWVGHKDGGVTIYRHYVRPNHKLADEMAKRIGAKALEVGS